MNIILNYLVALLVMLKVHNGRNKDETTLEMQEIKEQIRKIYYSTRTSFVDEIVLFKNSKVIKAYKKK